MANYLLKEDGSFILQEDGFKVILQVGSSPSASVSPSASISPSASRSPSSSISSSPSSSVSASISPSPSQGYTVYSRGKKGILPTDTNDLETLYTEQEAAGIEEEGSILVGQTAILLYMLHQFKKFIGDNTIATIEFLGQSTLSPSNSPVYLQIFNYNTNLWETLDSNNSYSHDQNFELTKTIRDLTNYKNGSNVISCRIYQLAV